MTGTPLKCGDNYLFHGHFPFGNEMIITQKHIRDSIMLVATGSCVVDHFGDVVAYTAPSIIRIEAKKNYKITVQEPNTILCCIHKLLPMEMKPPVVEK